MRIFGNRMLARYGVAMLVAALVFSGVFSGVGVQKASAEVGYDISGESPTSAMTETIEAPYVSGEVVVVMKKRVDEEKVVLEGDEIVAQTSDITEKTVLIDTNADVEAAIAEYESDPRVEYAQPNYIY